jgi:hypothetical protein
MEGYVMRAVVWQQPGQVQVTQAPDPAPGHGELIIQVAVCGICGTDVHIADGDFPPTPYPTFQAMSSPAGSWPSAETSRPAGARASGSPLIPPVLWLLPRLPGRPGNLCAHWNAIGDTVDGAVAVPAASA